jgi:hypothetical protein
VELMVLTAGGCACAPKKRLLSARRWMWKLKTTRPGELKNMQYAVSRDRRSICVWYQALVVRLTRYVQSKNEVWFAAGRLAKTILRWR